MDFEGTDKPVLKAADRMTPEAWRTKRKQEIETRIGELEGATHPETTMSAEDAEELRKLKQERVQLEADAQ